MLIHLKELLKLRKPTQINQHPAPFLHIQLIPPALTTRTIPFPNPRQQLILIGNQMKKHPILAHIFERLSACETFGLFIRLFLFYTKFAKTMLIFADHYGLALLLVVEGLAVYAGEGVVVH